MSKLNYSFDNGTHWTPYNHARVFENKEYTILARDKMGNISLPHKVDVSNYFKKDLGYPEVTVTRNLETEDQWCRSSVVVQFAAYPSQNLFKFNEIEEVDGEFHKVERLPNGNIKVTVKKEWTYPYNGIPEFKVPNAFNSSYVSIGFKLEDTNMTNTSTPFRWMQPTGGMNASINISTIHGEDWMTYNGPSNWSFCTLTNATEGTWWEISSIQTLNEQWYPNIDLRVPSPEYQPYFIRIFESDSYDGTYTWIGQSKSISGEIFYLTSRDIVKYYRLEDTFGNVGPVLPVRIRQDAAAPTNLNLAVIARSRAIKATVTANDVLSGIKGYTVSIDNGVTWRPVQIGSIFPFYRLASGTYIVKARAYDKAGNYVESAGQTHTI